MRKSRMIMALMAASLSLAGCAAQQANFRPAETTTVEMGNPATFYRITVDSEDLGMVKVYSEGAYANASGAQPVVSVSLRVRNLSNGPMSLDLSRCDVDVDTGNGSSMLTRPLETALQPIPPGEVRRIVLTYPLEGDLRPDDVRSFDFDWSLNTEKGLYANTTTFLRRWYHNEYAFYPMWWGPPYWGWGWGSWGWYGPPVVARGHGERGGERYGGRGPYNGRTYGGRGETRGGRDGGHGGGGGRGGRR